ncbi:MAG: acyl carrier protein [Candidatus Brocadia sp.]|nr:acyl carrier protein [Candidatus Brocadia sp.]NUO08652.1 acyl carrier protein [Candidatus Brocadia sp.]
MENITDDMIKEGLKKILAKELKVEPEDIHDNSHIVNDIGAESADMINLLYSIETEFDVEISNEEADRNLTVQKMVNLVKEKMSLRTAR